MCVCVCERMVIRTLVHLHVLELKVLGESCKAGGQGDRNQALDSCSGPCVMMVKMMVKVRVVMIKTCKRDLHMVKPDPYI